MQDQGPVKRPRHLMDPANPVRPVNDRAFTNVQRWVASVLATTTILHLSAGLVIAALVMDADATVPRVGLCVIAGAFGVIAVAVGLAIHARSPLSPWCLLGLAPTVVGLLLVL